jgi:hypothetical protein
MGAVRQTSMVLETKPETLVVQQSLLWLIK